MTDNNEIKTILFGPRNGKALLRTYPELKESTIFRALQSDELLFAWYMGIPGSPVDHDWDENIRWRTASSRVFQKDSEKRARFSVFDVSEEVKVAIREFSKFSPEARAEAKKMIQKLFHNFQRIVDVDPDEAFLYTKEVGTGDNKRVVTETDWTAKKQYIDSGAKISETLPSLLKQIEEGFGIQEKRTDEAIGTRSIDKYHQSKQETN